MRVTCLLVAAMVIGSVSPSAAQLTGGADAPAPPVTPAGDHPVTPDEDVEPRVIGTRGTTAIGLAGYADGVTSADDDLPLNLTLQVDVGRFLTQRIAVRGGVVGTGVLGGDPEGEPVRHRLGEGPGLGGEGIGCRNARGFQGAAGLPPGRAI